MPEALTPPASAYELTGDAAVSAAIAAGVPCEAKMDGGRVALVLAHPVSVWVDGGQIKVFTRPAT